MTQNSNQDYPNKSQDQDTGSKDNESSRDCSMPPEVSANEKSEIGAIPSSKNSAIKSASQTESPNSNTSSADSSQPQDSDSPQEKLSTEESKPSRKRRLLHFVKRAAQVSAISFIIYLTINLIGLIPVNGDFKESEDGVLIYFVSNPVHSDIILPLQHPVIDWDKKFPAAYFKKPVYWRTHISFGWGDKGFFLETPTWSDLKASTVFNALIWPSETAVHIDNWTFRKEVPENARSIRISTEQYKKLVDFISNSFKRDETGTVMQIPDAAYFDYDAFFYAKGRYHAFSTCNSWLGRALKETGIKAPVFSALPGAPLIYLPNNSVAPK